MQQAAADEARCRLEHAIRVLGEIADTKRSDIGAGEGKPHSRDSREETASRNRTTKTGRGTPGTGSDIIHPVSLTGSDSDRFIARVETLTGYGEAAEWAMSLKADLELWRAGELPWEEMSTKLLLSGPPGTGKTTFAQALCNSLQIPLIATSVATWMEPGYFGDVLKRMRAAFEEAELARTLIVRDTLEGSELRRVSFLHLDNWYETILEKKGDDFAWRCMKIWRALYNKMAAMKFCQPSADPSKAIRRKKPTARDETWLHEECQQLVDRAWAEGYRGLACIVAVAWDTQFNPGDVRALTPKQALQIGMDWGFGTLRRKTGGKALGLLSARTRKLVQAYVDGLGYELLDDAPIFRTRGYAPGPKGGRPRQGVPYTKGALISDFAKIREMVFGPNEKRQLRDMRRAGAQEALAGGVDLKDLATSMVNDIDDNEELRRTYGPTQAASVRATAESRERGRLKQASEHNRIKKLKLVPRKS